MPQRARDRSSLNTSHELLHYRDDRAVEVSRQKIEHPKDRRRGKQGGYHDLYSKYPIDGEFRRARRGRPLEVRADDVDLYEADGGRDNTELGREKRAPRAELDLWEIAKPGRVRRDLPKGFEVIPRLREVVALDEEEEEWEDDFEIVDLPKAAGKKPRTRSFAQAVKGKRRER